MRTKNSKKRTNAIRQKTNLGKPVQFFTGMKDIEQQFEHDVTVMAEQFRQVTDCFDLRNPWDESVLTCIACNIIGFIMANAERDGRHVEETIKEGIMDSLQTHRKLFAEENK